MRDKEIFMVKGASGSGKSTRYLYLIRFLKSIGCFFDEVFYENINGQVEKVGITCEDFKLFFLGRISDKTGLWRGMDDSLDIFMKIDYLFEFIKEQSEKYAFCIEGSSVTRSNRFRPIYFHKEIGFNRIMIQYYNFDSRESFMDRKFIRSGKVGDNGWHTNDSFKRDMDKSFKEAGQISGNGVYVDVFENNYNAPIYDSGAKVLAGIGADFLINDFVNYCNKTFKQ